MSKELLLLRSYYLKTRLILQRNYNQGEFWKYLFFTGLIRNAGVYRRQYFIIRHSE